MCHSSHRPSKKVKSRQEKGNDKKADLYIKHELPYLHANFATIM